MLDATGTKVSAIKDIEVGSKGDTFEESYCGMIEMINLQDFKRATTI